MHLQGLSKVFSQEETKKWMEAKQFRRSEKKQILTVKWYCLLYYRRFPLLCIKRDAPCQLQINCHFHFLNFPTVSSVLHIRKILVHWPFLEKSGPRKWVVGATLALKQNFLAGTLTVITRLHYSNVNRLRTIEEKSPKLQHIALF